MKELVVRSLRFMDLALGRNGKGPPRLRDLQALSLFALRPPDSSIFLETMAFTLFVGRILAWLDDSLLFS